MPSYRIPPNVPLLLAFLFSLMSVNFTLESARARPQSPQTAADYLKAGQDLRAEEKIEPAIQAFRRAVELDPNSEEAYLELSYLLGVSGKKDDEIRALYSAHQSIPSSRTITERLFAALLRSGRDADLIQVGREFMAQEPGDIRVMTTLGAVYAKNKQFADAAALWEQVVALDEKNAAAWFGLGGTYTILDRTQDALHAFQHVMDIVPKGTMHNQAWAGKIASYAKMGLLRESLEEIESELRLNPDNDIALLFRAVNRQQNNPEEAIADANRAAAISENPVVRSIAYSVTGSVQVMISRYKDAIASLKKSIELFPENAPSHALLAAAYFYSADYDTAMDELDLAIHSKLLDFPILDNAKFAMGAFNNLAMCLVKIGRPADAEKALRYSAQLDPKYSEPRTNLALLLLSQKRYADAESELQACIRLGSADWRTYATLGSIFAAQKRFPECIPPLRQALRLQPGHPMILNDLGYALAETNTNLEEAVDLLGRAAKLVPRSAAVRDSLGWAYFKSGDLHRAEEELLSAVKLDPMSYAPPEHLGDVYEKMGRKADALNSWKSALKLTTDDESRIRIQSRIDNLAGN